MVTSPRRCTPPMPPVAKTWMPAMFARIIVVATVVAPVSFCATTIGKSRRLTLSTPFASHMRTSSSSVRPREAAVDDRHRRRNRALLADDLLHLAGGLRFSGYGMPWLRMVLSSATTGLPVRTASSISGVTSM